ncbi:MAG TPA: ABC transporter ATP-binding protein [Casimicrobiaceae bacterium]|nr:ABC transporter ATP-binding protein [Casimicrobiaceae bacterium]
MRRWRYAPGAIAHAADLLPPTTMDESARPTPSVRVRNVTKTFDKVSALTDVSLDVGKGEFISFVGPSGCGKTTLLRLIAGLERPTSGAIEIGGVDVSRQPPYQRNIGLVFQNYALFPHKSVADNVNFGLRHRTRLTSGERRKAIDEALELVRLRGYGGRRPSELSGGQQQRIALARAIVTRPEVLLLDEPLSNLDAKLRDEMRVELTELHHALDLTFVYVTHDQAEALSMSDRVAVLRAGRVDQVGSPQDIFERPNSVHVAAFIGQGTLVHGTAGERAGGLLDVRLDDGSVLRASAPPDVKSGSRVQLLMRRNGATIHRSAETAGREPNSVIAGRVRAVLYQGLHVDVHVELANGARLRVERPAHEGEGIATGDAVFLHILPAGTWVLADDRGE